MSRAVINSFLELSMHGRVATLPKTDNIDQILMHLKEISHSHALNFTVLDSHSNVLYSDRLAVVPNMSKTLKKHKHHGISGTMLYAASTMQVGEHTFVINNSMNNQLAIQIRKTFRFVFGFFTIASLFALSSFEIFGFRLFTRKKRLVESYLTEFLKHKNPVILEKLQQHQADPAGKAFLELWNVNQNLSSKANTLHEEANTILETLDEGIIILDTNGVIKNINLKASQLLKLISIEFLGKSLKELIEQNPSQLGKKCLTIIQSSLKTHSYQRETFELENESEKCFEIIVSPVSKRDSVIVTLQDHSSDYKVLSMGKNFVTNASHELRTPITIIRGFTETLRELEDISPEMLDDITDKILRNCQRMSSVVKSLLVLADLDYAGKASMQACDLVGLVESCSYTILSAYPTVKIETLYNEKESLVWGDPDLLELAVMNLIENAIKYSPNNPFITITVETLDKTILLSIKDRGVGISEGDLLHIFERFYTVDKSRSRKMGGAGLGLSIVKTIVDKHDAKIDVASKEMEGTTFTIMFRKR